MSHTHSSLQPNSVVKGQPAPASSHIDEAVAQIDGEIYPAAILEYARAWRDGWDGHMVRLTDTREP